MGLDISAYSKCQYVGPFNEGVELEGNSIYVRADDKMNRLDGKLKGQYCFDGESVRFLAGSYSGYNIWRNQLCCAVLGVFDKVVWASPETYMKSPFFEIINFSDCEGGIGPETSAKLANDFKENREKVFTKIQEKYFQEKYDAWTKAFELAADNGFVIFH